MKLHPRRPESPSAFNEPCGISYRTPCSRQKAVLKKLLCGQLFSYFRAVWRKGTVWRPPNLDSVDLR